MEIKILPMSVEAAVKICGWKYEEPYSLYSMDEESYKELMNGFYYLAEGPQKELIGYFCYGESATVPGIRKHGAYSGEGYTDIGLGMKPNYTGLGHGPSFVLSGIRYAKGHLGARKIRLTVASFNTRAIKAYEKSGFKKGETFLNESPYGKREFMIMTLDDI